MHRLLLSIGLSKSVGATGGCSGKTTHSTQVWKVLLLTTHNSAQSYSSVITSYLRSEDPMSSPDKHEECVDKMDKLNFEKEASMNSSSRSSREGKAKRSREFVSPLRPKSSKKMAKGRQRNSKLPLLICLDDIPLPETPTSKSAASLGFIPLPTGPPPLSLESPPLPPPLPMPPPPPSHSEREEEALGDFFIIDRTSTSTLFPIPLPPHLSTIESLIKVSENASTSKSTSVSNSLECDSEEVSIVCNSDMALRERLENINLVDKSRNNSANTQCSSRDDIDIVFEGQWPWVVSSPGGSSRKMRAGQGNPLLSGMGSIPITQMQLRNIHQSTKGANATTSSKTTEPDVITLEDSFNSPIGKSSLTDSPKKSLGGQEKQQFLRKKLAPDAQVRGCHHSTSHGLKTIEKSPEPVLMKAGTAEADIITLDTQSCSILNPSRAEDFISLDSNANKVGKDEKNMFSFKPMLRAKSKKSKATTLQENEVSPLSQSGKGKELFFMRGRERSPDIKKVTVIDPDVVELDDNFPSSSTSTGMNYEVIDVYDCENERSHTSPLTNGEVDVNLVTEGMDIVDVCESENEVESSSDSSDHEEGGVDITNGGFVALKKAQLKNLENTQIDLDDEVLDKREDLERLRKWHMTNLGHELLVAGKGCRRGTVFSVMSYNVLAQQLLEDNKYLYKDCAVSHLHWQYRWALLQHEINQLNPDVLMLQEVQASHYFSHFLPWLSLKGYKGLYKKRTGEKCDGCAIFYKTSKFSLVEHCTVEYFQPKAKKVLNRDNIGIIAKLATVGKSQGPEVCIATTHFLYNPKRHDVKLAQAVLLLTELDRICYKGEQNGQTQYCPVIVTGDFNAEPHTSMVDLMRNGRLHYEGMSARTLTQYGSSYPVLGQELIPQTLGVTDRCQHAVLAQSRYLENLRGSLFSLADKRKLEECLIRFSNSDRADTRLKGVSSGSGGPAPSGWFSHDFKFKSVYSHYVNRAPEATTFHNKWTTVDYIFYSRVYSRDCGKQVEGPLKLLSKYGLLLGPQAPMFAPLPSAVCPSDHFPLAAQFFLQD